MSYYIPLLIGVGIGLLVLVCIVIFMIVKSSSNSKPQMIGTLKVATDEDGVDYMFLEVDKGKLDVVKSSDKILLRVEQVRE